MEYYLQQRLLCDHARDNKYEDAFIKFINTRIKISLTQMISVEEYLAIDDPIKLVVVHKFSFDQLRSLDEATRVIYGQYYDYYLDLASRHDIGMDFMMEVYGCVLSYWYDWMYGVKGPLEQSDKTNLYLYMLQYIPEMIDVL